MEYSSEGDTQIKRDKQLGNTPLFYRGLVASAGPLPIRLMVEPGKRASSPDRHPPIGYDLVNQRSFPQTSQSAAEVIAAPYELLSEIEH